MSQEESGSEEDLEDSYISDCIHFNFNQSNKEDINIINQILQNCTSDPVLALNSLHPGSTKDIQKAVQISLLNEQYRKLKELIYRGNAPYSLKILIPEVYKFHYIKRRISLLLLINIDSIVGTRTYKHSIKEYIIQNILCYQYPYGKDQSTLMGQVHKSCKVTTRVMIDNTIRSLRSKFNQKGWKKRFTQITKQYFSMKSLPIKTDSSIETLVELIFGGVHLSRTDKNRDKNQHLFQLAYNATQNYCFSLVCQEVDKIKNHESVNMNNHESKRSRKNKIGKYGNIRKRKDYLNKNC